MCVESYQLVPLLKALRMPRVSLLIADDIGLGKTVETGLILTKLWLRRRIQRVLVLTPASLRRQWQEELWEKFSLRFEVVDRRETERLRRRLGMDANPWRSFSRIVASYHYLEADPRELALSNAFDAFRAAVRKLVSTGTGPRRRAGTFAVEILGKRLLSCPTALAESWSRARQGFMDPDTEAAVETELAAAERAVRQETDDDREAEQRAATATTVIGAWLRNFVDDVAGEIEAIEYALTALGFVVDDAPITEQTPFVDTRFDALVERIESLLRAGGEFRDDERLIVFTEYKTTLDYLARRLRERYPADRVLTLFGTGSGAGDSPSMDEADRENVKAAFNDPTSSVRILVATDAASEGLNLHRTARYLLHYDCPWNPSRLEQRNGRLDRYGQARDVTVHHFVSNADRNLRFFDHVIRKADDIREDLGSVNEVFDRAVHRRLIQGEDEGSVTTDLDRGINAARGSADLESDAAAVAVAEEEARDAVLLDALATEIDLDADAMRDTLETAMAIPHGRPQLRTSEEPGFYRVLRPGLPGWRDVIDESVRRPAPGGASGGPMPRLAFSPEPFIERLGQLSVFQPRRDALLMHLAHPMMQRALGMLTRRRYPGVVLDRKCPIAEGCTSPRPRGLRRRQVVSLERNGAGAGASRATRRRPSSCFCRSEMPGCAESGRLNEPPRWAGLQSRSKIVSRSRPAEAGKRNARSATYTDNPT